MWLSCHIVAIFERPVIALYNVPGDQLIIGNRINGIWLLSMAVCLSVTDVCQYRLLLISRH